MTRFPVTRSVARFSPVCGEAARRRGLTLLELVVVLAILVAIAAILVPLLPELLGKGNQSAAATNMSELEKAVQTFRVAYSRCPNHYDSMLTADGAVSGLVPASPAGSPGGGTLEAITLTTGQVSRLTREGINMVYDIENAVTTDPQFHATMNPFIAAQPYGSGRAISGSTVKVLALKKQADGTYNDKVFDGSVMPGVILNKDHNYAVFGVGKYCNLCGPDGIVKEAPIFGQHKQQNTPATSYQRFAVVFDVGLADTDTSKVNAKFVGAIAIAGKRLFTAGDLVGTYGDNRFDISQPPK